MILGVNYIAVELQTVYPPNMEKGWPLRLASKGWWGQTLAAKFR